MLILAFPGKIVFSSSLSTKRLDEKLGAEQSPVYRPTDDRWAYCPVRSFGGADR
jgi:hypothetical protein